MRKNHIVVVLSFVFLFAAVSPVAAHHKERVLGAHTSPSEIAFPPVTSGPGFILPDSPFYFLDQAVQQVRLVTAVGAENRARVHAQIAGERLAELRTMMARNNNDGIKTALDQLTKETELASEDLADASSRGKDVEKHAKDINEAVKMQRDILKILETQTEGELKLELRATREALKAAKVQIEDDLPEEELEREIEDGLNEEVEDAVDDAAHSVASIERDLQVLEEEREEAAKKALEDREGALKKAIEEKNQEKQKAEARLLELEKKRQEEKLKVSEEAAERARAAVRSAQEAAKEFETVQKEAQKKDSSDSSGSSESSSGKSGSGNSGKNSSPSDRDDDSRN